MSDEINELLDTALYKEIASQSLYSAALAKAGDADAKQLLQELVLQEEKHADQLRSLKEKGLPQRAEDNAKVTDLRMSEYLVGPDKLENAGFQDIIIFAIKREQEAIDFYSRMTPILREQTAKEICQQLVHDELGHKLRLETLYDDLIYRED